MNSPHGQPPNPDGGATGGSPGGPALPPDLPEPASARRGAWLPSLVWLVPLIAALIGIALVVKTVASRGPTITITFSSAEGLETGKTKVKYKDVDIGTVKTIRLSKDHARVLVEVQLTKEAADFAVDDTRFWVVRPRIGTSGVTGLGTLLSGAYIGIDAGRSHEAQS
ncbi:MAG: paraquat-inducible protein, partial [Paraburkholderia sp.]|nr:paraquat-inducible protein [Paraburkholderia sp.]